MQDRVANTGVDPSAVETLVENRLYFVDLAEQGAQKKGTLRAYFKKGLQPDDIAVAEDYLKTQMGRTGVAEISDVSSANDSCWTQISLTFRTYNDFSPEHVLRYMVKAIEAQRQEIAKAERAAGLVKAARESKAEPTPA